MMSDIVVRSRALQGDFHYRGTIVLTYLVHYPVFESPLYPQSARKIDAYYRQRALHIVRGIATGLYPQAVEDYEQRQESDFPFNPYDVQRDFTAGYIGGCVASLYFDLYQFTGGAHGTTVRTSDTWDVSRARTLPLSAVFPGNPGYREELIGEIQRQIAQERDFYFENAEALARESFDEESYYLTDDALVIYYQQYDIAPYAFGIPEFSIPYGQFGAQIPRCGAYRRESAKKRPQS